MPQLKDVSDARHFQEKKTLANQDKITTPVSCTKWIELVSKQWCTLTLHLSNANTITSNADRTLGRAGNVTVANVTVNKQTHSVVMYQIC